MNKPKAAYRVWIEQVSQTYFDVDAEGEEDAMRKATRLWRDWTRDPGISGVKLLAEATK